MPSSQLQTEEFDNNKEQWYDCRRRLESRSSIVWMLFSTPTGPVSSRGSICLQMSLSRSLSLSRTTLTPRLLPRISSLTSSSALFSRNQHIDSVNTENKNLSAFCPMPHYYGSMRIDPVSSVQHLNDPLATAEARLLQTLRYLVYLHYVRMMLRVSGCSIY